MPDAPAAIRAVFSEWRMVKTRKVLALIFEVPLEQQAEVLTMLGAPMPDAEIWCGIARLTSSRPNGQIDVTEPPPHTSAASQRGKDRYASSTDAEKAVVRAARLPKDLRFQSWLAKQTGWVIGESDAVSYIQSNCCEGGSRSLIATNPEFHARFIGMETQYLRDVGVLTEPR